MRDYSECYDLSENVISITTLIIYFSGSFELINNNYIRIIQIPGKKIIIVIILNFLIPEKKEIIRTVFSTGSNCALKSTKQYYYLRRLRQTLQV